MFEDSLNLAENKLILLYIFHKVNLPIPNIQLSQIVLENNFMNYFTLQQYIVELVESNLLTKISDKGKDRLVISESGKKVLNLFENRISYSNLQQLNEYIENKLPSIKKELTVTADYTIENNNSYVVSLIASENDIVLMDLKVSLASNKQARDLCHKWNSNSSDLYNKIIHLLLED
ncbi:DUF4364 family protein [Clostridium sp.]|jgi:predicted transcriptional regulator|uniref:DUF4364 family protein n=1 Tax=Clostridium sp. TaxID=1506 RepID=UPI002FC707DC